jgi:hypothetical protein
MYNLLSNLVSTASRRRGCSVRMRLFRTIRQRNLSPVFLDKSLIKALR